MSAPDHVQLPDGRRLDVRVSGPDDGLPLVFHHGTPGAATPIRELERAVHARGLRLVTTSRPGYGGSTRQPGRTVADREAAAALLAKGLLSGVIFDTDDCDATFEKVRASGAEVLQEPIDQFYGVRDCAFRDPAGNMLRFSQPLS